MYEVSGGGIGGEGYSGSGCIGAMLMALRSISDAAAVLLYAWYDLRYVVRIGSWCVWREWMSWVLEFIAIHCVGCRVWGEGPRVSVWGVGWCRVYGAGFTAEGEGFRSV